LRSTSTTQPMRSPTAQVRRRSFPGPSPVPTRLRGCRFIGVGSGGGGSGAGAGAAAAGGGGTRSGSSSSSSSRTYHSASPEYCLRQDPQPQEGPQPQPSPARPLASEFSDTPFRTLNCLHCKTQLSGRGALQSFCSGFFAFFPVDFFPATSSSAVFLSS